MFSYVRDSFYLSEVGSPLLRVAPVQIHPNGWAFIRCFYLLCQLLGLEATPRMFLYFYRISNSRVLGDRLISFARVWRKRLLGAFESSYKKKTYHDRFFKLKARGSATQYFYRFLGVAQFPLRWSSIVTPSPRVVISDFFNKEKSHVEVLERLSSDIITSKWEGIGCTDLIRYFKDSAILHKCFCESFAYYLFLCSLILLMLVT